MIRLNQIHQWPHMRRLPGVDWAIPADIAEGPVGATKAGSRPTATTRWHWKSPDPTWAEVDPWAMYSISPCWIQCKKTETSCLPRPWPLGQTWFRPWFSQAGPISFLAKWQPTCQEEGGVEVQAPEQQQWPGKRLGIPQNWAYGFHQPLVTLLVVGAQPLLIGWVPYAMNHLVMASHFAAYGADAKLLWDTKHVWSLWWVQLKMTNPYTKQFNAENVWRPIGCHLFRHNGIERGRQATLPRHRGVSWNGRGSPVECKCLPAGIDGDHLWSRRFEKNNICPTHFEQVWIPSFNSLICNIFVIKFPVATKAVTNPFGFGVFKPTNDTSMFLMKYVVWHWVYHINTYIPSSLISTNKKPIRNILIYIYIYIYVCICIYIYIYTHTYAYTYTYHTACINWELTAPLGSPVHRWQPLWRRLARRCARGLRGRDPW